MTESVYGPSWYAATMVAAPEHQRLVYDIDVDVCVIGGGLAGLTTARELARYGWSVALLEASRVAWNASGRNVGIVAPGFAERPERIIERVGLERARALWILSAGGVDYIRSAIRDTQMAGVSPVDGHLTVQRFDNQDNLLAQADLIGNTFGTAVEAWSTDEVRQVVNSSAYFQALHLPGAFHIHPLNYALGLAGAAEAAGVKIFEQTRALAIDAAGVRKRITTPAGLVRAGHVVLAGNTHLDPLCEMVSGSILPVVSYVAITAPLGDRLKDAIAYYGSVSDTRRAGDSYRVIEGDRLLWGGRIGAHLASPRRLAKLMARDIRKVFPQLGEVEITHAWSGVNGYAVHKMPQIGEVSPGLWVASAFGAHGLNTTAMAGELIARAIRYGDDHWRLFESYDLVHVGGAVGRAAGRVLYWTLRVRDAIDEQLAWRRGIARRRQEAMAAQAAEEARRRMAEEAARLQVEEARLREVAEVERQAAQEAAERAAREAEAERQVAAAAAERAAREAEAERQVAAAAAERAARDAEAERQAALEAAERAAREAAHLALQEEPPPMVQDATASAAAPPAPEPSAQSAVMASPEAPAPAANGGIQESAAGRELETTVRVPEAEAGEAAPRGKRRRQNIQATSSDGDKAGRKRRRGGKAPITAEMAGPAHPKD